MWVCGKLAMIFKKKFKNNIYIYIFANKFMEWIDIVYYIYKYNYDE